MQRKNDKKTVGCPVESTIGAIGGRWKVLIIHHLIEGRQRFGELTRLLGGISARTLTRQLRELEASGIIQRETVQEVPLKVEYSLTPLGQKLKPVLDAMHQWGQEVEQQANTSQTPPPISPIAANRHVDGERTA
ncbi:putative HTH-type transcriptional regulator YybR [Novipirellula galeiformis]|uniref:Putative HTH-type transcriptional regulator YybR n=1 Tax=Novipirellula galeiformis TaxID=2528004 RepID=A0A5C6BFM4_9BACT|nr:helix-turn-helix domain-containing protein [Novipirellula galeiformis]TWU10301.1 putative HTH-type transcriptional regulator YybR [Novipirellula galeiformis]